jgi:hypothetical protein
MDTIHLQVTPARASGVQSTPSAAITSTTSVCRTNLSLRNSCV